MDSDFIGIFSFDFDFDFRGLFFSGKFNFESVSVYKRCVIFVVNHEIEKD